MNSMGLLPELYGEMIMSIIINTIILRLKCIVITYISFIGQPRLEVIGALEFQSKWLVLDWGPGRGTMNGSGTFLCDCGCDMNCRRMN